VLKATEARVETALVEHPHVIHMWLEFDPELLESRYAFGIVGDNDGRRVLRRFAAARRNQYLPGSESEVAGDRGTRVVVLGVYPADPSHGGERRASLIARYPSTR
jgi:hypothetical protein